MRRQWRAFASVLVTLVFLCASYAGSPVAMAQGTGDPEAGIAASPEVPPITIDEPVEIGDTGADTGDDSGGDAGSEDDSSADTGSEDESSADTGSDDESEDSNLSVSGDFSAAAEATGVSIDQHNPLPGETVNVTITFQMQPGDEGSYGVGGSIPFNTTYVEGSAQLNCSTCTGVSGQNNVTAYYFSFSVPNEPSETFTMTYQLTVNDGVAAGTVITVASQSDGPQVTDAMTVAAVLDANDDSFSVAYAHSYSGTLTATGGVGALTFTIDIAAQPTKGIVVINPDGTFTYSAAMPFTGADSFGFIVSDSRTPLQSDSGTISVTISDPVTTDNPSINVPFEGSADGAITASGGVGTLTYTMQDQPLKGDVTLNDDGTFTYDAHDNVTDFDYFSVMVSDTSDPALVAYANVWVMIAQPPDLTAQTLTLNMVSGATITGDLNTQVSGGITPYFFTVLVGPTKGQLTLNPDGTFTYIANADAVGDDSFTYTVTDSHIILTSAEPGPPIVNTATGTVEITIQALPDPLTTAPLDIVVAAGSSIDGNLVPQVGGGVTPYTFGPAGAPTQGIVTVNPDGTFTYTANDDGEGSDSFTYTLTDSQVNPTAAETATGLVNITITAEPPTPSPTATPSPTVEDEPTATPSPTTESGVTPSPTSGDSGNLPQNPNPTSTPTVASGGGSGNGNGNGNGSGGGVTTLPSTGTTGQQSSSPVLFLLLAGLVLLAGAGIVTRRRSFR